MAHPMALATLWTRIVFLATTALVVPLINNPIAHWWEYRATPCDPLAPEPTSVIVLGGGLAVPPAGGEENWAWMTSATATRLDSGVRLQRDYGVPLILTGTAKERFD